MTTKFTQLDLSKVDDDKALAIAGYGESVAAYRYIVLAEKAPTATLRESFEKMAQTERAHRERVQGVLKRLSPQGSFYLSPEDKLVVCVGPRLVDARDDARFDEAMKLVISSEKRTVSFYLRYANQAKDPEVKTIFAELAVEGIQLVRRLRELFKEAGKNIAEACPVVFPLK